MNITVEDILARLTTGETVDEIAAKFTDTLNQAIRLNEEAIKEAEEKAAKAAKRKAQEEAITGVVNALATLFEAYDRKNWSDKLVTDYEENGASYVDMMEELFDEIKSLINACAFFSLPTFPKFASTPAEKTNENKMSKDPITDFLKTYGLI